MMINFYLKQGSQLSMRDFNERKGKISEKKFSQCCLFWVMSIAFFRSIFGAGHLQFDCFSEDEKAKTL